MCGIVGLIDPERRREDVETSLRRMAATLTHRGPDDEGFLSADGSGVGMRRLSIIDVAGGRQPLSNETGTLHLVLNGEIYNHLDLRRELESKGHVFRTRSDAEAALHGYEAWGPDVCRRLDGMFALCLYDAQGPSFFLARDRLGKKPLYYARLSSGGLAFGSEIKALLALGGIDRRPCLPALYHYLTLQYVPDPLSAFEGILKLPPAHALAWRPGEAQPTPRRYWQLEYEPKAPLAEAEAAQRLRSHLERAVRARLMSEVPLGAFLSGGLDSSIVVGLMAEAAAGPVKTFSIGFKESAFSELPDARRVADHFQTEHHEFIVEPRAVETLPALVAAFDEPFADPSALPVWYLSELTRRQVTVALNGDGGDELFAGYQRYALEPWLQRWRRVPKWGRAPVETLLARGLATSGDVPIERDWRAGLRRLSEAAATDPRASIVAWGSYFSEPWKREWLSSDFLEAVGSVDSEGWIAKAHEAAAARTPLDRALATDIATYLPGDLLVKVDRMTMAHSVEARSPFLDHHLAEFVARLPTPMKLRWGRGKALLRRAFRDRLPAEAFAKPKQGFGVPVSAWFRQGPLADRWRDRRPSLNVRGLFKPGALDRLSAEHHAGAVDHGKRLWALLMLEEWFELYQVQGAHPGCAAV